MTARLPDIARLITLENGKARADAMGEATYAAEFFRWFAEEAVRADGLVVRAPASGARIVVQHKPAGIAVLVTPWNFPAAMGTRKIAPALAAGCPVIIKPASATPLTMLELMPLFEEAGVPKGVVNVLPSKKSGALIDHLLHDPRVRVISFTGSTEVGRKLLRSAADCVVTPAMELGGNAPVLVFEDADIETAVEGSMVAKMRNMGEACTAANRFYVHESVAEDFAGRLTEKMAALKMGDGLEEGIDVGPLVNSETRDKVAALVDDAVAKGAELRLGGAVPNRKGFFYPPTVLTGRAGRRRLRAGGNLRAGSGHPNFPRSGRRDRARQRHRIWPRGLCLHAGHESRDQGVRAARLRHGRAQPRPGFRSGRAVRRHEAVGSGPRGRTPGHVRIHGDAIHLGELVRSAMNPFASPARRAQARRAGADLAEVADAAGRGTLTREDVDRHAVQRKSAGAPPLGKIPFASGTSITRDGAR